MISNVAGTTHGFSFYANDTQEVDFAFLTSDTSHVYLTNEQITTTSPLSTYTFDAPSDATTAYHEYRVDWNASTTTFWINGELVHSISENVPSTPGLWLWNNCESTAVHSTYIITDSIQGLTATPGLKDLPPQTAFSRSKA